MATSLSRLLPIAFASLLLLAHPAAAERPSGALVGADWLARHLADPQVVVLDASPAQLHAARHVPGAVGVDFLAYGFPERPLADMEQRYQSWGLAPEKTVVIYDQGGTYLATRLLFALYHHGFPADRLHVLDGGLAKWQELGHPVTTEATPAPARGTFRIADVKEEVRVRLPEFLAASGDRARHVLVEALDPDWHYGKIAFFGRPGHVPHSVMLPTADLFNADKTFKSPDEIRRILGFLGITPERRAHSYCGGGLAASVPFFAIKFLAGYPNVTLYQESLMGYVSDDRQLPLWTYDAPFLLREAAWLQSWGGQTLRAFKPADISIVDVRSAAAFAEGHVPYAVNVPADEFRRHLAAPTALAEALGRAGVNPAHEAVIVSGAGLTKDAALAFVVLEKLGQARVSVLANSLEAWAGHGFPVTKDATAVRTPTGPRDIAVPPATFSPALRDGIIATGTVSSRGTFPTVYLASGPTLPAAAVDGTVVHVPYTALLDDGGAPKPATEIWGTLSKAGVPRYAELVCVSDDPAEAAANYVVLKMMGFRDVKVLVR